MKTVHTFGTRKSAVARATLRAGSGIIRVNGRSLQSFSDNLYKAKINEPMIIAGEHAKNVNIDLNIIGGGVNSQAEAARLAISKALSEHDKKLRTTFLEYDRAFLVADVRAKETHKPNRHGKARAKRQKSYR